MIRVFRSIYCDAGQQTCGRWTQEAGSVITVTEMRAYARKDGWTRKQATINGHQTLIDLCPLHSEGGE